MEHSETATSFQGKKNEEHDAPTCGQSQAYDSDGNTKKTKGNDTQRYCNTEIIIFYTITISSEDKSWLII